jgi:dCTP deaminase
MSLVSYLELLELVKAGVIEGVDTKDVNGTSIDVHLGSDILIERYSETSQVVSLRDKQHLNTTRRVMPEGGHYDLRPGEFILAHTVEKFNLPADISAEFKLNSSGARIGLENALATWCDPHWTGSVLTLELKNFTQFHTIRLHNGCRIGQMIFHKSEPVPAKDGYGVRGRYNGDSTVSGVKS